MTDLLPNLGGEEGPGWRNLLERPPVLAEARLWRLLFAEPARLLYAGTPDAGIPTWPEALGAPPEEAAFPWLADPDGVVPWIATRDAAEDRRVAGRRLAGAAPEVVEAVHDKAFAHAVAREERLLPPVLRDCIAVLEPDELRASDAVAKIEARLSDWPAWARARFTLKPRIGSSARGRVAGEGGRLDAARLGSALERLASQGGAMLEPWLERTADLSVQLHVAPRSEGEPGVTVLGTLAPIVSASGHYLGHRGEIDSRGRVFSGHPAAETLREAAALVAVAARERGYAGPCGIDAFEFNEPGPEGSEPILRPLVELNARFTTGTVTIGLIRRALPRVKEALGLAPGERMRFRFQVDLPEAEREAAEAAGDPLLLDLDEAGPTRPALVFSRSVS